MRIGINTLSESPGRASGAADYLRDMVARWSRLAGDDEYFVFVSSANAGWFQDAHGIRLVMAGASNESRWRRIISEQLVLPMLLRRHRIDVLFSTSGGGVAPLLLPRRTRLVVAIYGTQHLRRDLALGRVRSWYRRVLGGASVRRAARVVVNSAACRDDVVRAFSAGERIVVIPHGIDRAVFHPGAPTDAERRRIEQAGVRPPYVLFVSTIWPYKNADTLVEAFGRFVTRHGTAHELVLVGRMDAEPGYAQRLLAIAEGHGIRERLRLVGPVAMEETRVFYRLADAYVQPSFYETFGKSVVEAQACGCPVIAANTGATPEVVGDAGVLVDPYDAQSLTRGLEAVLLDAATHCRLAERGPLHAGAFSLDAEAERLARVFREAGRA